MQIWEGVEQSSDQACLAKLHVSEWWARDWRTRSFPVMCTARPQSQRRLGNEAYLDSLSACVGPWYMSFLSLSWLLGLWGFMRCHSVVLGTRVRGLGVGWLVVSIN